MKERRVVTWQLRVLLAKRNIRSAAALARLMFDEADYKINASHVTRYLKDDPPNLSLEFLSALATTLEADLDELFEIKVITDEADNKKPTEVKKRRGKELPTPYPAQKSEEPNVKEIKHARKPSSEPAKLQVVASKQQSHVTGPSTELFPDVYNEDENQ